MKTPAQLKVIDGGREVLEQNALDAAIFGSTQDFDQALTRLGQGPTGKLNAVPKHDVSDTEQPPV